MLFLPLFAHFPRKLFKQLRPTIACGLTLGWLGWIAPIALSKVVPIEAQTDRSTAEIENKPLVSPSVFKMEQDQEKTYEQYFGRELAEVTQTPEDIAQTLLRLEAETGTRAAVLWIKPEENYLHLVLVTPGKEAIVRDLSEVPKATLLPLVQLFRQEVTNSLSDLYLPLGKRLHQWMIDPFEKDFLEPENIDTLLICAWGGLRSLPFAALQDGEQFLIEKYAIANIPAFNLIDHTYSGRSKNGNILAMGASEFQTLQSLPAVPLELQNILNSFGGKPGRSFLNADFTVQNLEDQLQQASLRYQPIEIVHLATHAAFLPGTPNNSYIQFWDRPLRLDEMSRLNWKNPPLELLVLSACETALGNAEAELGFAGLALQSGVKSALASLWSVSDSGTLALMSEFYQQLQDAPTKAQALRQSQLYLLQNKDLFQGDRLVLSRGAVSVPQNLELSTDEDFSHPFFWAGFTLISSPW